MSKPRFLSKSGWEHSYFGGPRRILIDHPSIDIDRNINFEYEKGILPELRFWERDKLMKIFLLQVNNQKLVGRLMFGAKSERKVRKTWGGKESIYDEVTIDKDSLYEMIYQLSRETAFNQELIPLFQYFKEDMEKVKIIFENPIKEEKKDSKNDNCEGQGENEEEDQDDNREGEVSTPEDYPIQEMERALSEVREYEPYSFNKIGEKNFKVKIEIQKFDKTGLPTKLNKSEKSHGERIFKLLDITFDPKPGVVKSLRAGQLDLSKIAEIPAGNLSVYKQKFEEQETKPFGVCILLDESASMLDEVYKTDTREYLSKIDAAHATLKSLYHAISQIVPDERLFIYGHSGYNSPSLFVYHDPHNPNFLMSFNNIKNRRKFENNYDGPIIEEVHKRVRSMTSDRMLMIVLSDGTPYGTGYGDFSDFQDLKRIIEKCRRDEFVTVGIGILHIAVKDLYTYSTVVKELDEMPKQVSHIINKAVKMEFQ